MKRLLLALALVAGILILAAPAARACQHDGRHDFDFEIGTWKMSPSGDGHVVRRLWDGATIAQLIIPAPKERVRGSLLGLYNPATKAWSIYWADAQDGTLSTPLVGCFRSGIGTFTGRETAAGGSHFVRLVFSHIERSSFETVQSTSIDGRTWTNANKTIYTRSK